MEPHNEPGSPQVYPAAAEEGVPPMLAGLQTMTSTQMIKIATALGLDEDEIDEAEDMETEEEKATYVRGLIEDRVTSLRAMKFAQVKVEAQKMGIDKDQINAHQAVSSHLSKRVRTPCTHLAV